MANRMEEVIAGYWEECVANAIEEAHVTASLAQVNLIAESVRGAHENYGMAFYQPENPLIGEVSNLKRELKKEKEKVFCLNCEGTGRIITNGPSHSSNSECMKCRGAGKYNP